jgi:alpha-galactosidase
VLQSLARSAVVEPETAFALHLPHGLTGEARAGADGSVDWWVANETRAPISVDRVALVGTFRTRGAVRVFSHGYQSWTASGMVVLGVDPDPSRTADSLALVRGMHHADAAVADAGELRSELVTAIADDYGAYALGFDGGSRHDGTFRIRARDDRRVEVSAEAYLGGAMLAPGARRALHALRVEAGDPLPLLERWADWAGASCGARTDAPYQVGWCSWYQYFHGVTELAVRDNLARAGEWPFDVFQLDDGYQRHIGDWLARADTFPTPLDELAAIIASAGYVPGIWIAPFLVAPGSDVAHDHPDWVAAYKPGRELVGMVNPGWSGAVWTLDTTHPAVLEHLEVLARTLVEMGWQYLKLDFTYAPALAGTNWHDPSQSPAERVRAGYDAIRRGAGDDAFILGCGAPLGPCIGVVDAMRIGADVARRWHLADVAWRPPGYEDNEPATVNAWRNTLTRAFHHRRLWLNDPDCLMLRTDGTDLSEAQVHTWAHAVAASGGLALVSDDLGRLGPPARALLAEVVDIGRHVDDAARAGRTPRCVDLLDAWTPTTLAGPGVRLVADPARGTSQMTLS